MFAVILAPASSNPLRASSSILLNSAFAFSPNRVK
uniref:Uncharacterized protein n=1 Tax=Lotus japonicus TaxID=34305 RepID=I3SF60_LOTJA|nr:unknown [Lotus japonicus]